MALANSKLWSGVAASRPPAPSTTPIAGESHEDYVRRMFGGTTTPSVAPVAPSTGLDPGIATQPVEPRFEPSSVAPQPSVGYAPPSSSAAPVTTPAVTPPATSGGGAPTLQSAYQDALMKLLTGGSPQDAGKDVFKSPAVTAYNESRRRQEARDRAFLAERASADGFSGSGGFESGVLGLRERANQDMNRFAGEQAGIAEQGRREELLRALSLQAAMGDSEAARALQRELGMAGIGVQREGLDVQRAGIGASRDNTLDQLGFNYAQLQQNQNSQFINQLLALLGGG